MTIDVQLSLAEVNTAIGELKEIVTNVSDMVAKNQATLDKEIDTQHRNAVLIWLQTCDYVAAHNTRVAKVHPGTCGWVVDLGAFRSWLALPQSTIWLHGESGTGKTSMAASVIQYLQHDRPPNTLTYFYYDSNDASTLEDGSIFKAILHQLVLRCFDIPQVVQTLYEDCTARSTQPRKPILANLQQCLAGLINTRFASSGIIIVIDALNESNKPSEVLGRITSLQDLCPGLIRLFLTSGHSPKHQVLLGASFQIDLNCQEHDQDISQ